MLFAMGVTYATLTMLGDHYYAWGMKAGNVTGTSINYLRLSARLDPFDADHRSASARVMGAASLQVGNESWLEAARLECIAALQTDFSAADILLKLVAIDLKLNRVTEAQFMYDQFKRVDAKSPVIAYVEKLHVQAGDAVTGKP